MRKYFGLGDTKKSTQSLIKFVKSPVKFFKTNKDNYAHLVDVMTLIIFASAVIETITELTIGAFTLAGLEFGFLVFAQVMILLIVFVLARIGAMISLWIGSIILNLVVRLFAKKDNRTLAMRVTAYSSVVQLIPTFPFVPIIAFILSIVLTAIGVSKQYKLGIGVSILIAVFIPAIVSTILYLIFYYSFDYNIFIEWINPSAHPLAAPPVA